MILNSTHENELISPARSIAGKVELYEGSTLLETFKHTDALSNFTLSRAGANKFFGFGVCQELEVKLVDRERAINITKGQILKITFTANNNDVTPAPNFYITEVTRDENTNELTVKACDIILYQAKDYTISELNLVAPYNILDVLLSITRQLDIDLELRVVYESPFVDIDYPNGANFDGAETLREVLDAIAEATQTIYFVNNNNALIFKNLTGLDEPVLTVRKSDYFTLETKEWRMLDNIGSTTELGDSVVTNSGGSGETQYIRDNPFLELRDDLSYWLESGQGIIAGLVITPFTCKWRGNYLLEPGDLIVLVTKDNMPAITYLLDEKYTYNGGLSSEISWNCEEKSGDTIDNPTNLGDKLKQTFARVDKANKKIELVVSDVQANAEEISSLELTTDAITASVSKMDNEMANLSSEVSAKMSAEDVNISIQTALDDGVERVTTTTGFTFNEDGLHITKSNSEITTSITEDGMTVYRNNDTVLTADNLGVKAEDLHATTFLIIGGNSRLEDYNGNRTGCFWIGG